MFNKIKKIWKRKQLAHKQKKINKKFMEEGLTDEVLDAQVELNQLRNKLDIEDENNRIYENFVQ